MAIHVCVTCDEEGCDVAQSVGFDSETETFGDLLAYLRASGWDLEGEVVPSDQGMNLGMRYSCPKHRGPPASLPVG